MSKIAILTDSSCDIPQELAEKYGIGQSVAPCVMQEVMESTMPKQWNIGTWIIIRSAVDRSIRSPMHLPSLTTL